MWSRRELKTKAKDHLRGKYWYAFAAALIVSILSSGSGSGIFTFRFNASSLRGRDGRGWNGDWEQHGEMFRQYWDQPGEWFRYFQDQLDSVFVSRIFILVLIFAGFAVLLGLAYQIFVAPVVQVGGSRWFSRSREAQSIPAIGQVFSPFRSGQYLKTVGSMLWMNLFLFLWGLLAMLPTLILLPAVVLLTRQGSLSFGAGSESEWLLSLTPLVILWVFGSIALSIPSIIKSYSYRMTPWILADNPQIGHRRALKLSIAMTHGHKMNIFVLDLSFIGWFLLGVLACGIGVFFVTPYVMATYAELFAELRQSAVKQGYCTMEDLGFFPVTANPPVPPAAAESIEPPVEPDSL